jgi:hypothetical protein
MTGERRVPRVVPEGPVIVGVRTEAGLEAFGFVVNISPWGACLLTDLFFASGTPLHFTLSFPRDRDPMEAPGRVVWAQEPEHGQIRCGLEFDTLPAAESTRLASLIDGVTPH